MGSPASRYVSARRKLRHLSRSPDERSDNISHHLRWESGPDDTNAGRDQSSPQASTFVLRTGTQCVSVFPIWREDKPYQ